MTIKEMRKIDSSRITETKEARRKILTFPGSVDEDTDFTKIDTKSLDELVVDLERLSVINSCGTRNWVKWISGIPAKTTVVFVNCSRIFIDQANMFEGFLPKNSVIKSFFVPYFCESCKNSMNVLTPVKNEPKKTIGKIPKAQPCKSCGEQAELDVIESHYFRFLERLG